MNSEILDIKFARLAAMLLPVNLRKPRLMAVLDTLSAPLAALLAALTGFRKECLQNLRYSGQTCRLEYCLNYRFGNRDRIADPGYGRRIRVIDGTDSDGKPYIIYRRAQLQNTVYNKPKRRGCDRQVILNRRSVNSSTFYNFIIECPEEYYKGKETEFAAVVNTYKTQGKTWTVRLINS